jgi:hypothetical protein
METNDSFPLPPEWKELESILTDMKVCRESGDPEGYNKCVVVIRKDIISV